MFVLVIAILILLIPCSIEASTAHPLTVGMYEKTVEQGKSFLDRPYKKGRSFATITKEWVCIRQGTSTTHLWSTKDRSNRSTVISGLVEHGIDIQCAKVLQQRH